jgi:hypothetical protein
MKGKVPMNNHPRRANLPKIVVRHTHVAPCLLALLLLAPFNVTRAQFSYVTNNGAITITRYTDFSLAVTIP